MILSTLKKRVGHIKRKIGLTILGFLFALTTFALRAEAYTLYISLPTGKYSVYYDWEGGIAIGYNVTQGYAQNLLVSVGFSSASVTIPDDGCTWQVSGYISGSRNTYDSEMNIEVSKPVYVTFSQTITTSGTFTGYSPKTATNAANNAYNAANTAATNAQNAYNAANAAKSSADAAKSSADAAKTSANIAATNAQNAYNAANTAATNAQNAYNAANAAKASADQAAANTTYSGQSAAYWAYQAAQGGADTTPPTIQKIGGLNGATCTTSGTFYVVVQATDNRVGQLQARAQVDGGTWTGWYNIPQSAIPVTLSSAGAHTITVEVMDAAGNSSQATMTAFRV